MTREELIEEARKAVHAVIPGSGPYDSWNAAKSQGMDFLGDIAEAAFAVFEKAQAPTDDEREALAQASVDSERLRQIAEWLSMEHGHEETAKRVNIIADRHDALARRPAQTEPSHGCSWACGVNKYGADEHAQTEPTEKQVEAAAREYHERGNGEGSFDRVADHIRASLLFRIRAALRAAFTAGQEEQS